MTTKLLLILVLLCGFSRMSFGNNLVFNEVSYSGFTYEEGVFLKQFLEKSLKDFSEEINNFEDLFKYYDISPQNQTTTKKFLNLLVEQNYVFEGKTPIPDIPETITLTEDKVIKNKTTTEDTNIATPSNKTMINPVYVRSEQFKTFKDKDIIEYYKTYRQKYPDASLSLTEEQKTVPLQIDEQEVAEEPPIREGIPKNNIIPKKEPRRLFFTVSLGYSNEHYMREGSGSKYSDQISYISDTVMLLGLEYFVVQNIVSLSLESGVSVLHNGNSNYFSNIVDSFNSKNFSINVEPGIKFTNYFMYVKAFVNIKLRKAGYLNDISYDDSFKTTVAPGLEIGLHLWQIEFYAKNSFLSGNQRDAEYNLNLEFGTRLML